MAKSVINIGTAADDGTGDSLRAGATKINANSDELYNALGDGTNLKDIINSSMELDVPNDDNKINKVSFHASTLNQMNAISPSTYHGAMLHVHEGGSVYVAHAAAWRKLLLDASAGAIPNYTDPLKSVAYVGNINSLSDVDTTSTPPQTGNVLKWDGGKWAPGTDATTGGAGTDADTLDGQDGSYYLNYNNLNNRPTVPSVLTDLSISDGSNGQVLTTDGNGTFTFTTISTGGNQNLFQTVDADTGTTTANSTTDTLTVAGGANISTSIVGDTLSIAYTGSPNSGEENQNPEGGNANQTDDFGNPVQGSPEYKHFNDMNCEEFTIFCKNIMNNGPTGNSTQNLQMFQNTLSGDGGEYSGTEERADFATKMHNCQG